MNQVNNNTVKEKGKHLSLCERIEIEKSLARGFSIRAIARALERPPSTISREVQRGSVVQRRKINSYSKKITVPLEVSELKYFADTGQRVAKENSGKRGGKYKLFQDPELLRYIEDKILKHKMSPDAIIGQLKLEKHNYKTMVNTKTIYNYIDKGLMRVKNIDLLLKCRRTPKKECSRVHKRLFGNSIEQRPEAVALRQEFGHYEGDTIIGKDGKSAVLTIVERKTRKGFMLWIKDKTAKAVLQAVNKFKNTLPKGAIKTITLDNGSEFARLSELKGIGVYYAHPYSAYERGGNENYNGIIRRFLPKGKDLSHFSQQDLNRINNWIDSYPRKILGYQTAEAAFEKELQNILFLHEGINASA